MRSARRDAAGSSTDRGAWVHKDRRPRIGDPTAADQIDDRGFKTACRPAHHLAETVAGHRTKTMTPPSREAAQNGGGGSDIGSLTHGHTDRPLIENVARAPFEPDHGGNTVGVHRPVQGGDRVGHPGDRQGVDDRSRRKVHHHGARRVANTAD